MQSEINPQDDRLRRRIDVETLHQPTLYWKFQKNEWVTVSLLSAFAWPESCDPEAIALFADCM